MLNEVIEELKNNIENFELRNEQIVMIEKVLSSMEGKDNTVINAPTGTGKSFGYLIPFLIKKIDDPSFKMTISTYTINLQNQIIKDLELIKKIYSKLRPLEKPLKFTIMKGKRNYFCEKRFLNNQSDLPLPFINKINVKIYELRSDKKTIDQQNLSMKISNAQWDLISVEECSKKDCPFYEQCNFYNDYFKEDSDLVIANHALFFNREVYVTEAWDDFSYHVFDEAHKIEKVILDVFTFDLTTRKVEQSVKSLLNICYKYKFDNEKITEFTNSNLVKNITFKKFEKGLQLLESRMKNKTNTLEELNFNEESIIKMIEELQVWQKNLYLEFKAKFDTDSLKDNENFNDDIKNWLTSSNFLTEFKNILNLGSGKRLLWVEKNDFNEVFLKVTPIGISNVPNLFKKGTLFTSGTLLNNNSLDDYIIRMNIAVNEENKIILNTPFDLKNQCLTYIANDINPRFNNYEDLIIERTYELLTSSNLKSFVLFTSKQIMDKVFQALKPRLIIFAEENDLELDVFLQDKNNNFKVIESFKDKDKKSVLFGSLSYFEGISLEREDLTQVILTRLPYSVPTHPIQKILDLNEDYSKWEAFIRFEQAFGRLIRTKDDYGNFAILDSRIKENYNKAFLNLFEGNDIPITYNINEVIEFFNNKN